MLRPAEMCPAGRRGGGPRSAPARSRRGERRLRAGGRLGSHNAGRRAGDGQRLWLAASGGASPKNVTSGQGSCSPELRGGRCAGGISQGILCADRRGFGLRPTPPKFDGECTTLALGVSGRHCGSQIASERRDGGRRATGRDVVPGQDATLLTNHLEAEVRRGVWSSARSPSCRPLTPLFVRVSTDLERAGVCPSWVGRQQGEARWAKLEAP